MIAFPTLSPQIVQAIEKKAQPSIWSQLFSAAVANRVQKALPQAPVVASMQRAETPDMMPLLLIGGLLLVGAVMLGRRS